MSEMANTTPLVTTVTKPATNPRDANATPRVNIQELCEDYYEVILPIIMDKVRHDRRKDVHTRLDFREGHRERTREDSHHSSARARVMLKVSPWKGVVRFIKRGKLNPRYIGPFKVLAKIGDVAYRLELLQELSRVHHTFHVLNLKKCYIDESLAMPLEGVHIDDTLQFTGTLRGVLSSPGNAKTLSNKSTHISSQPGLRHPLKGILKKMPPRKAPRTRITPATATATTLMTDVAIRALMSRGMANALA
nr:putative reverse transcriptase domain-containing protein [Tanacetum cinerariifolium]